MADFDQKWQSLRKTAAWKYYPTILLPATLMGFPWRREKSDSRQKYRSQRRQ